MPKELRTFIPIVKYFNDDDSEMNEEQISSLKEKEAISELPPPKGGGFLLTQNESQSF